MRISIDFKDVSIENAVIPVLDHGFLFGDSVYEVVRTLEGRLIYAREHLERMQLSASGIGLPLPWDNAMLIAEMERMHSASGDAESYVRLIVTRGTGTLELATHTCTQQRLIVIQKPLTVWPQEFYSSGAKLSLVSVLRNQKQAMDPAFKTGNYLNNVLAIEEARKSGATEAVMLNRDGYITECTTANVFWVKAGVVRTPALDVGILSGITRAEVLAACRDIGQRCEEGQYPEAALLEADEVFITSTTRDVMPITRLDDRAVGVGKVGPVTQRLMQAYTKRMRANAGQ